MGLEDHLLMIQRQIELFKPTRLVVDSLSALERIGAIRYFREFVIGLTSHTREKAVQSQRHPQAVRRRFHHRSAHLDDHRRNRSPALRRDRRRPASRHLGHQNAGIAARQVDP